jgi:hypothetical protein
VGRSIIVTSSPPAWKPLTDITALSMRRYADRHGYDFFHDVSDTMMPGRTPFINGAQPKPFVPLRYYVKFHLLEYFLDAQACGREYDEAVWLDADCLIANADRVLSDWTGEIVTAYDCNGVHPTVIMARKTDRSRAFLWACNNIGRTLFQHHDWSDNECLRYFNAAPPYRDIITFYSAQDLCAMSPGVYPIPPAVREPYELTSHSWTLHLSALPLQQRVALAQQFLANQH